KSNSLVSSFTSCGRTAERTLRPSVTTSWPMPSPGITARLMLRDMRAPYSSSHALTRAVRDADTRMADGPDSVAGRAAVVPAVQGALQGCGGVLPVGLGGAGGVADAAAGGRLGHGRSAPSEHARERAEGHGMPEGAGNQGPQGVTCTRVRLTTAIRLIERDVRLLQK